MLINFNINPNAIAECNHTDIRLADGRNSREGRVEICVDGKWGTVCDDQWDLMDALVACKQLGMPVTGIIISYQLHVTVCVQLILNNSYHNVQ